MKPFFYFGDPCLSISELLYTVDFRAHFFNSRNRISAEDAKLIAEKYKNGCSLRDIAKLVGRSKSKIRRELQKTGIEPREKITQATNARSLKSGKQGARPYYGFCYFEGQIVKDPREFPTLQLIHHRWNQRKTIHEICLELNRAHVPSRTGRTWSWASMRNILNRFEGKNLILHKGGKYEFR